MNKFKFIVLSFLEDSNADTLLHSMSCYDIQDELAGLNYTANYILRVLNEFEKAGLVKRGLNDRRSVTFYITDAGKKLLEEIRNK